MVIASKEEQCGAAAKSVVVFPSGPVCREGEAEALLLPTPCAGSGAWKSGARLPSSWISQGWGCKEMLLLTQGGSDQKLLTVFCWTKRGEGNSAHSHPCRSLSGTWKSREENGIRERVLLTQPLPSGTFAMINPNFPH